MPTIEPYRPLDHGRAAYDLWQSSVVPALRVSELIFHRYTAGRLSYEPGDGVVAVYDGRLVGFALLEVDRHSTGHPGWGSITAVAVEPGQRRSGLGTRLLASLEDRLRAEGVTRVCAGGNFHAFAPGIPAQQPEVLGFFTACGYEPEEQMFDLIVDLTDRVSASAANGPQGVTFESLTPPCLSGLLALEEREFRWWVPGLMKVLAADLDNVIIARCGSEIVGALQTFNPGGRSRHCAGGMQRGPRAGSLGAIGAVGIAEARRGTGLGRGLCEFAFQHLLARGAALCYIEQVEPHIVPFYEKLGGVVCAEYRGASKRL